MARKGKKNERFGIIFYVKVGNELNALVQVSLSESSSRTPNCWLNALGRGLHSAGSASAAIAIVDTNVSVA